MGGSHRSMKGFSTLGGVVRRRQIEERIELLGRLKELEEGDE